MQTIKLGIIRKYATTWTKSGKLKCINTDDIGLAEKKAILNNGQVWINTRYESSKRLQRIYVQQFYKGKYNSDNADYPNLLLHNPN